MIKQIQHASRFILYLLKAKHRKGYGIHSPFSFDIITNVFEENNQYYIYDKIEQVRKELLSNDTIIDVVDYGTGKSGKRKISDIASKSLKKKKHAQLLFRLVNACKPDTILELGTSLGITTAYLASVNSNSKIISLEGCPQIADVAKSVLEKCNVKNASICIGNIDENLPYVLEILEKVDFVFFDANHSKEATLSYFYSCLNQISDKSVFVFDDIHYSKEMEKAWNEIKANSNIRVSYDLFSLGIVFFNPLLKKQDYILLF